MLLFSSFSEAKDTTIRRMCAYRVIKKRGANFPACSNLLNQNLNYENLCFHQQMYAIICDRQNESPARSKKMLERGLRMTLPHYARVS